MAQANRGFRPITARVTVPPPPVDDHLAELGSLIEQHDHLGQDSVIPAIGARSASRDVVQRVAVEFYCLERWMTPEFPMPIASRVE
jgi:hypothetical protein